MPPRPPPPKRFRIDALAFIEVEERDLDHEVERLDFLRAKGVQTIGDCFRRFAIFWERVDIRSRKDRAIADREFSEQLERRATDDE